MSKVSIEIDLSVVQKAINAKVQPAVDAILAKRDIPKLIEAELNRKDRDAGRDYMGYFLAGFGGGGSGRPMIEGLIRDAVYKAAEEFVKKRIKADRAKIEKAFVRMMRESPDVLAKTMLASLDNAINDEWSFEIATKITPKEPERD